jgi:hypothetical protein
MIDFADEGLTTKSILLELISNFESKVFVLKLFDELDFVWAVSLLLLLELNSLAVIEDKFVFVV